MNHHSALELLKYKTGIFRATTLRITTTQQIVPNDANEDLLNSLPEDVLKFIKIWKGATGYYINGSEVNVNNSKHETLNVNAYIHITSPIRRLVDLLNQFILTIDKGLTMNPSKDAMEFVESWLKRIDYINASMRSIRKIQTDCELLHRCHKQPNIMTHPYDGILFDKIRKNDGSFVYMVYLPKLKLLSRLKTYVELPDYSQRSFRIYLFAEEHSLKKKIRVKIV
jgi:hypothetical protein